MTIYTETDTTIAARATATFARKYRGVDVRDLRQEAEVAVLEAARTFDPERGVQWGYYAWRACMHKLAAYARWSRAAATSRHHAAPTIRVDVDALPEGAYGPTQERYVRLRRAVTQIATDAESALGARVLLEQWRPREVAQALNVEPARVYRAVRRARARACEE